MCNKATWEMSSACFESFLSTYGELRCTARCSFHAVGTMMRRLMLLDDVILGNLYYVLLPMCVPFLFIAVCTHCDVPTCMTMNSETVVCWSRFLGCPIVFAAYPWCFLACFIEESGFSFARQLNLVHSASSAVAIGRA